MRRISLALALVGAVAAAGCSGTVIPGTDTGTGVAKGVPNVNYYVNLFSAPIGGWVTSDTGGINCGASSIDAGVPTYIPGHNVCGANAANNQTEYAWATATVTLTATPNGTNTFIGWAGDCTGSSPTCVLQRGADKMVVAIFGAAGSGHANFMDGAVHGPAYMAYVAGTGALDCDSCHGPTLAGKGIAPSCATCHPNPGPSGNTNLPPTTVKTGLAAAITSVNPATNVVTFTVKDGAGVDVDITGADGKNLPMPVTMGIMNFATDAGGNALPYKNSTGGNPATVSPFAAITSMTVGSSTPVTYPVATNFIYPEGTLTKGGVACTFAAPCSCGSSPNNCVYLGNSGTQYDTVAKAVRACTTLAPCTCSSTKPCAPALPTVDGPGMTTFAGGVYTYTFAASPFNAATVGNTHTAWLATYRRENLANNLDGRNYTAVNVQFNFDAATGAAVAAKREIVTDAACAKCHDGFKAKAVVGVGDFHSSARIAAPYCNVCHYEGRGTNGFADSATFVHRIHAGKDLTQVTTGTVGAPYYQGATSCSTTACTCTVAAPCSLAFHGMVATYPQDVRNCGACHDGAAQGAQAQTRPTIAACGSCHDTLATTFLPVSGLSLPAHPASNPAVRTNADCDVCHTPTAIANVHVPTQPIDPCNSFSFAVDSAPCLATGATVANSRTNSGALPAAGMLPPGAAVMAAVIDSVQVEANGNPSMNFKFTKDGADVVFNTWAAEGDEMMTGFTGSPNIYFAFSVPQDGVVAPDDFNVSVNGFLKRIWNATATGTGAGTLSAAPDANGFYKVTLTGVFVPASASILTGGIGYAYSISTNTDPDLVVQPLNQTNVPGFAYDPVTHVGGLHVTMPNVWKVATGVTGRRTIVDNTRCLDCHAQLGALPSFHVGQRNDGPTCSFCHDGNRNSSGWSANSKDIIHGIHAGPERSVPYMWHAISATNNFAEVEFPRPISDCQACHAPGTYDLSAAAFTASAPELLWSTQASGTPTAGISLSPYVTAGNNYGAGFAYNAATGVTTTAAVTTLVTSPISAACFGCHDTATARTHMEESGGWIYKARGAFFDVNTVAGETCVSCHGPGATWSIDLVH